MVKKTSAAVLALVVSSGWVFAAESPPARNASTDLNARVSSILERFPARDVRREGRPRRGDPEPG